MLCYSGWPYNLLHTNLSAQAKEKPPLSVCTSSQTLFQISVAQRLQHILQCSSYLTGKQRVLFKLWQVHGNLLAPVLRPRLQQNRLSVQFAVTVAANLAQHRYAVLEVESGVAEMSEWTSGGWKLPLQRWLCTCAGRDTLENSSMWKWDLMVSPRSSIFSDNTGEMRDMSRETKSTSTVFRSMTGEPTTTSGGLHTISHIS